MFKNKEIEKLILRIQLWIIYTGRHAVLPWQPYWMTSLYKYLQGGVLYSSLGYALNKSGTAVVSYITWTGRLITMFWSLRSWKQTVSMEVSTSSLLILDPPYYRSLPPPSHPLAHFWICAWHGFSIKWWQDSINSYLCSLDYVFLFIYFTWPIISYYF